jgi:protein-S-isoprenylcysteine O-methyltransferase Ste14
VSEETRRLTILPPRATWISLLVQVPGIAFAWPLQPRAELLVAGASLGALAVVLNVLAASNFSRRGIGIVPFSDAPQLSTRGIYRLTRNPMYVGLVLFSSALWIGSSVWPNFFAPLLLWVWLHLFYVLPEEAFLKERFGSEYDAYCRRVPRWL